MNEISKKLDNGATLLYSKKDTYFSYVAFDFKVGSEDEAEDIYGCAHILEHMLFNGTKKFPKGKIEEIIEDCGGYTNAYTSEHNTRYFGKILKNNTKELIEIFSEMCFAPLLKEDDFNSEKKVVMQEMFDRNDDVWNFIYDDYFDKCFGKHQTIGTEYSIKNMTYSNFKDFYNTYYNFNNLVISVVSSLELETIEVLINDILSRYTPISEYVNTNEYMVKDTGNVLIIKEDNCEQDKIITGFRVPKGNMDICAIYSQILGGGMTSKLFKNIREEKKLCYNIFSFKYDLGFEDYIGIGVSFNDSNNTKLIIENINKEIDNMLDVEEEEFNRAKTVYIADLCATDENSQRFMSALITRHNNNMHVSTEDRIAEVENITISDFKNFIKTYCLDNQMYGYWMHPTHKKSILQKFKDLFNKTNNIISQLK